MRVELAQLLRGAEACREHLNLIEAVLAASRLDLDDTDGTAAADALKQIKSASPSATALQRSAFSGAVISLYGHLEQFVELLATNTAERFAELARTYDDLPAQFVSHHTPLTLEVLNSIQSGRYAGTFVQRDLVAGLQHALERYAPVRVNAGVYAQHTANFRAETVRQVFERLGVSLKKLDQDTGLCNAMHRLFPGEGNMFYVVDDLAQRRNEVAHGADFDALSFGLTRAYIDMIAEYGKALVAHVASAITQFAVKQKGLELGRPDRLFHHGSVAGYHSLRESVEAGDTLGVLSGAGLASCVRIVEVQVESTTVDVGQVGQSVGIKLSGAVSSRHRLFLLPRELSYLILPSR